jgi:hypothetical protein
METETTIHWDETGEPATLWTASVHVKNEWKAAGFPVKTLDRGWGCLVPVSRITYKVMKSA